MTDYRVDFEPIPWQSPLEGVRFKAYVDGNRRIRLVEYSRGFVEPDWCPRGHVGYVLEGEFEVDFNVRVVHYAPGDGIFIPSGEAHKHKAHPKSDLVRVVLVEEVPE